MSETSQCKQCGIHDAWLITRDDGLCSRCAGDRDFAQAIAYREIAASLGMEGQPVEEVVERVKQRNGLRTTLVVCSDPAVAEDIRAGLAAINDNRVIETKTLKELLPKD